MATARLADPVSVRRRMPSSMPSPLSKTGLTETAELPATPPLRPKLARSATWEIPKSATTAEKYVGHDGEGMGLSVQLKRLTAVGEKKKSSTEQELQRIKTTS